MSEIILLLITTAIREEPAIAEGLRELFKKSDPTDEDWAAFRARVLLKRYKDFVPDSAILEGQ